MEPKKWPFRPQHITCDGEIGREDLKRLTGEGIISNEYLRGIQTSICADLENPTTIIEFAPDGTCVRTDSKLLIYSLHDACRTFRDRTKERLCFYNDEQYARLFQNLKRDDFPEVFNERQKQNQFIQSNHRSQALLFQLQQHKDGRYYLEYDCPILGFRELIFPIFSFDGVIAVLFVGELCLMQEQENILTRQDAFFSNPPAWTRQVEHACDPACWEEARRCTLAAHTEWVKNEKNILTSTEYDTLIEKTCALLKSFEEKLEDKMELHRMRYVRERMEKIAKDFKKKLAEQPADIGNRHQWLWGVVKTQLDAVCRDFNFSHVVIFAAQNPLERDVTQLVPVAISGEIDPERIDESRELALNLRNLQGTDVEETPHGVDNQLLNHIVGVNRPLRAHWHRCYWLKPPLFSSHVPEHANWSAVAWIAYPSDNPTSGVENKPKDSLEIALKAFFDLISTTYSTILAGMVFTNLENTMRIFGHEAGQLTAGLDWLRLLYFKDPERLRRLSDQKAEDLSRDLQGYFSQLTWLTESTSYVAKNIRAEKQLFLPYKEILFKWRDIYRLEARNKSLHFEFPIIKSDDKLRPEIYADQKLLEQVIYNLVNNAVKYCFRGTNIYIDAKKNDEARSSPYLINVIDYGFEIETGSRPYELYSRGKNVPKHNGMGIGLFIAKKIVDAHGGKMYHTCEEVSQFNVPLIQPYLKLPPVSSEKQRGLTAMLQAELARLKAEGKYHQVVALDENNAEIYKPTLGEIFDALERPIYKVTFCVEIPSWEARK